VQCTLSETNHVSDGALLGRTPVYKMKDFLDTYESVVELCEKNANRCGVADA